MMINQARTPVFRATRDHSTSCSLPVLRVATQLVSVTVILLSVATCAPSPSATPDAGAPITTDAGGGLPVATCPDWRAPPALGVLDAKVDPPTAQRIANWRKATRRENWLEQLDPALVRSSLRLEQVQLDRGCVNLDQAVDVGRGLFLRRFTRTDGWGDQDAQLRRVQSGEAGGPDAFSCQDCHWKGGAAGSGDRVDNTYMLGDGDDVTSADVRNPPALWGAGWRELVAAEISAELQRIAADALARAAQGGEPVRVELRSKGIYFGEVEAFLDSAGAPQLDTSSLYLVDPDLVVKPFGWKGNFPTLREFIGESLQVHMGLQAEERMVHHASSTGASNPTNVDADNDGVSREITEGELSALTLYVATLDAPPLAAPDEGVYREPVFYSTHFEFIHTPEAAARWQKGFSLFQRIGCTRCHVPYLPLNNPVYEMEAPLSGTRLAVDLASQGAKPVPEQDEQGRYLVAAFSDFRRHDMGPALSARYAERGVSASVWLTRPLWGLAMTSPYLHTGEAMIFDDALALHGGEAELAANNYRLLREQDRESIRFFLASLARAPMMRIR